jgi:hypothetical protein
MLSQTGLSRNRITYKQDRYKRKYQVAKPHNAKQHTKEQDIVIWLSRASALREETGETLKRFLLRR